MPQRPKPLRLGHRACRDGSPPSEKGVDADLRRRSSSSEILPGLRACMMCRATPHTTECQAGPNGAVNDTIAPPKVHPKRMPMYVMSAAGLFFVEPASMSSNMRWTAWKKATWACKAPCAFTDASHAETARLRATNNRRQGEMTMAVLLAATPGDS